MSKSTLICLAPVAFLALWGSGMFGGGSGLSEDQRVVCLAAVATLAFLTFLEYDNSSPWHELQHPRLLKGLRLGPTLAEGAAMLVVYCTISGLPPWDRLPALALLLAPLAYPTVMQGFHRFQVRAKGVTRFRCWVYVACRVFVCFSVCVCSRGSKTQREEWVQLRGRMMLALFSIRHPPAQRG